MKIWLTTILAVSLSGCVVINKSSQPKSNQAPVAKSEQTATVEPQECIGSVNPPIAFAGKLTMVVDEPLLQNALGDPGKGGLCQGKVYEVTEEFTIFRAWNSTNPGSEKGKWWAFYKPDGAVAQYREDYEICYQWSPLDVMTECKISVGSKIVIGNGQSAECSQYLTYDVSAAQQIYLEDAANHTPQCTSYIGTFSWTPN